MKRSVSARPSTIAPVARKRRKTNLSDWFLPRGGGIDEEEEEGEDSEEYSPFEESGKGTAIHRLVEEEDAERDADASSIGSSDDTSGRDGHSEFDQDETDVQQELLDLKEDMDPSGFHDAAAAAELHKQTNDGAEYPRRSTRSVSQRQKGVGSGKTQPKSTPTKDNSFMPRTLRVQASGRRKPSIIKKANPDIAPDDSSGHASVADTSQDTSQKGSRLVRFEENQASQGGGPTLANGTTEEAAPGGGKSAKSSGDESATSRSVSDDETDSSEESLSVSDSSSSTSDNDSTSESEEEEETDSSDSESSEEEEQQKRPARVSAPGKGLARTKKNNVRMKLRRKLAVLKRIGALPSEANFDSLRSWESANGGGGGNAREDSIMASDREETEFERKRRTLLMQLESGGVDIDGVSGDDQAVPGEQSQAQEEPEPQAQPVKGSTLDVTSSKRLIFGALGVRTPRSKDEEEQTRRKLAGKSKQRQPPTESTIWPPEDNQSISNSWHNKLTVKATECVVDGIKLTPPPFPFEQRWDSEAMRVIREWKGQGKGKKRKGRGKRKKRKRSSNQEIYDDEEGEEEEEASASNGGAEDYENGDVHLNYSDTEMVNGEESHANNADVYEPVESDDLPAVPADLDSIPNLSESEFTPGSIVAYKQLELSKATNWQPMVSQYRVATVEDILEDGLVRVVRLPKRDRNPHSGKTSLQEEFPREYSGFEMPGFDDQDEAADEGLREITFAELIAPKLVQASDRPRVVEESEKAPEQVTASVN